MGKVRSMGGVTPQHGSVMTVGMSHLAVDTSGVNLDRLATRYGVTALVTHVRGGLSRWFDVARGGPFVFDLESTRRGRATSRWANQMGGWWPFA